MLSADTFDKLSPDGVADRLPPLTVAVLDYLLEKKPSTTPFILNMEITQDGYVEMEDTSITPRQEETILMCKAADLTKTLHTWSHVAGLTADQQREFQALIDRRIVTHGPRVLIQQGHA